MDTSFSEADLLFRDEVKNFFSSAYDVSLQKQFESFNTYKDAVIEWQKRLYKQGWIAPNWPVKYGGTGWSSTQKFIFEAERASAGIREVMPFGVGMVGPVIYTFGNEKQKEHFLPRILKSEDWYMKTIELRFIKNFITYNRTFWIPDIIKNIYYYLFFYLIYNI